MTEKTIKKLLTILFIALVIFEYVFGFLSGYLLLIPYFISDLLPSSIYSLSPILHSAVSFLVSFIGLGLLPVIILLLINSPLIWLYKKYLK